MRNVIVHPDALEEIFVSANYVDQKRPGYGEKLLDEIARAYSRISEEPQQWNIGLYGYRKYVVQHFGYVVWYKETGENLYVVAVHHGSRKPGYWKEREF